MIQGSVSVRTIVTTEMLSNVSRWKGNHNKALLIISVIGYPTLSFNACKQ